MVIGRLIGHRLQVCPHFSRNSRGYKRIPRHTDSVHTWHLNLGKEPQLLKKKHGYICSITLFIIFCCVNSLTSTTAVTLTMLRHIAKSPANFHMPNCYAMVSVYTKIRLFIKPCWQRGRSEAEISLFFLLLIQFIVYVDHFVVWIRILVSRASHRVACSWPDARESEVCIRANIVLCL